MGFNLGDISPLAGMAADVAATKDSSTKMAKGGSVSASKRADGIAQRGKTRGKMR